MRQLTEKEMASYHNIMFPCQDPKDVDNLINYLNYHNKLDELKDIKDFIYIARFNVILLDIIKLMLTPEIFRQDNRIAYYEAKEVLCAYNSEKYIFCNNTYNKYLKKAFDVYKYRKKLRIKFSKYLDHSYYDERLKWFVLRTPEELLLIDETFNSIVDTYFINKECDPNMEYPELDTILYTYLSEPKDLYNKFNFNSEEAISFYASPATKHNYLTYLDYFQTHYKNDDKRPIR